MFIEFGDLSALIPPPNTFPLLSCFFSGPHLQGWWPSHCVCSLSSSSPLSLHELSWSFSIPIHCLSSSKSIHWLSWFCYCVGFSFWVFSEFFSLFLILYWKFQSCLLLFEHVNHIFLKVCIWRLPFSGLYFYCLLFPWGCSCVVLYLRMPDGFWLRTRCCIMKIRKILWRLGWYILYLRRIYICFGHEIKHYQL